MLPAAIVSFLRKEKKNKRDANTRNRRIGKDRNGKNLIIMKDISPSFG